MIECWDIIWTEFYGRKDFCSSNSVTLSKGGEDCHSIRYMFTKYFYYVRITTGVLTFWAGVICILFSHGAVQTRAKAISNFVMTGILLLTPLALDIAVIPYMYFYYDIMTEDDYEEMDDRGQVWHMLQGKRDYMGEPIALLGVHAVIALPAILLLALNLCKIKRGSLYIYIYIYCTNIYIGENKPNIPNIEDQIAEESIEVDDPNK